ncbi:MAG: 3-phosphoserine/phosphohydroxythreonine transaminase [Actinomycetia bacterium]|nr:3-phosphoserine/phosphohydroxythreonine transaminase [Actinomycetes bacterium]
MKLINFSAGPAMLPRSVLEQARDELVDYGGAGMSLVEMSHRGPEYPAVHEQAVALARRVFEVPADFSVLFLQGGATLQFSMVPMNLLCPGKAGGYVVSGAWAKKAIADGRLYGDAYAAWDGAGVHYCRMPRPEEIELREGTRYLHVTSNETIGGIQMFGWPALGVPLVGDMSSDYLSRPIPWEHFDVVYGGAQKNLGPAGVTLVFLRQAILESTNRGLGAYLRYGYHDDGNSLANTPPVFAIWLVGKVLCWVEKQGGLGAMEAASRRRAGILYAAIDASGDFYRSPVEPTSRSLMNVVFRLPTDDLEERFLAEAAAAGLVGLKGHRSVGGCRASIYNAMSVEGVEALAGFMAQFRAANG